MSRETGPRLVTHLIHGKLCRPSVRASIPRPRLLRQLGGLSHAKLALLCAEAGYGKTTLLLDFLRGWQHPAVWYRLDRSDRDVTQFVAYLTEGCAQHLPGFGQEIRGRMVDDPEGRLASDLPHLLVHELSNLASQPLLIVLDNFEAVVPSDRVCTLVSDLLEYSAPEVRFLIASRTMPPLPVALLQARQELIELGPEDLALSPEESRSLLLNLRGIQITDTELDLLLRRTEGWVAGLVMIAEAMRRSPAPQVIASLEDLRGSPDLVYRFFAGEAFEGQSPEFQDFLIKTSILKRLAHDAVNDLLGIENGGELLDALRRGGSFTHGVEAGKDELRYHPLFRAFLQQRLHARYSNDQIHRLYQRAAESACRRKQWNEAIEFYSVCEDWEHLAQIVEQVGEDLTRRGFLETVRNWLNLIPEARILDRPMLLLLRGRLLRQAGQHREALWDLERALPGFDGTLDRRFVVLAQIEMAHAHYWLGQFQRSIQVLSDALSRAGEDVALRSRVLAQLSAASIGADDLEQGVRWAEMAASEASTTGRSTVPIDVLVRAYRFHGRALVFQGELQRGLQDLIRSADLCRRNDVGDLDTGWSLLSLGMGLTMLGSFDQARQVLDEAESLSHGSHSLLNWIRAWRGVTHRNMGAFPLAEQDFLLAGAYGHRELAFLRLRQGRYEEGLSLAAEAVSLAAKGESRSELAYCQVLHGIALARTGDRRGGLQQLTLATETYRAGGRRQALASAQWHLAELLVEDGRQQEGMVVLEEAVLWACRHDIYHFWFWDPNTVARLWPVAFKAGWVPAYLLELARSRLGPAQYRSLFDALDGAPSILRGQLMDTLHVVSGGVDAVREVAHDLLKSCHDPAIHRHVSEALQSGLLSAQDLTRLRRDARLTWKEIEVLTLYYLRPDVEERGAPFRRRLAEALALSEHTLKVHIRSIRRKLEMPEQRQCSPLVVLQQLRHG